MKKDSKLIFTLSILTKLLIFLTAFILILLLNITLKNETLINVFNNSLFWCEVGFVEGLILILFVKILKVDSSFLKRQNDMEDTYWLTEKKMRKNKSFKVFNLKNASIHEDGIVIGASKKHGDVQIIETDDLHALIVGTTGAGKTTGFVDQNIAVLSKTKNKPSLVITDPKCELYEKHSKTLKSEGYKVLTLDLRNPYSSSKWNPLEIMLKKEDQIKSLAISNITNKDGKYATEHEIFDAMHKVRVLKQTLKDEVYDSAKDLVYTLCPINNKDQPNWEEGARNLILGFILALLEDYEEGKIPRENITLLNVYHNIIKYTSGKVDKLRDYLIDSRPTLSNIKSLASAVLITRENTLRSYLSEVHSYLQDFTDEGILSLTASSDMELNTLDDTPTALFIIIPDEKKTRHKFATLFITQLYKELCEKANKNLKNLDTPTAKLKRNTYFILDEFGNLPQFENIEGMVTVARSRGIKFLFVLQSYAQLVTRYKKEVAEIIKTNCNVKIFIGTDDLETRKEFSELCGKKKAKRLSISSNEGKNTSSESVVNEPLISPGELERLNGEVKGNAIVSIRGYEPLWSYFTPSFDLKKEYFALGDEKLIEKEVKDFNKEELYFDIAKDKAENNSLIEKIETMPDKYLPKPELIDEIKELNIRFNKVMGLIERGINRLGEFIYKEDFEKLKQVDKADLIDALKELKKTYRNDPSVKQKIDKMILFIEAKIIELKQIQKDIKLIN